MTKKKQYNNPYYLELLKALFKVVKTGSYKNDISVVELEKLSSRKTDSSEGTGSIDLNPSTLIKIFPQKISNDSLYSFSEKTLNKLVKYMSKSYRYNDYPDFEKKEYCEFAEQFQDKEHRFYVLKVKEALKDEEEKELKIIIKDIVMPKVEERVNEILGRKNNNIIVDGEKKLIENLSELIFFEETIRGLREDAFTVKNKYAMKQEYLKQEILEKIYAHEANITPSLIEQLSNISIDWYNPQSYHFFMRVSEMIEEAVKKYNNCDDINLLFVRKNLFSYKYNILGYEQNKIKPIEEFYALYGIINSQLEHLKNKFVLTDNQFQETKYSLCESRHGICTTNEEGQELIYLAEGWLGDIISKTDKNISARKCTACSYIRNNRIEEAKYHLDIAQEHLDKADKDRLVILPKTRAFFYFIKSAYHLKKQEYTMAQTLIEKAEISFQKLMCIDQIDKAFLYYVLYKVFLQIGKEQEAKRIGESALNILIKSPIKNYCLFDYWEVFNDLKRNLMNE